MTYAQYAREGFAQLVVVAVLTLAVVAGALRWARTADARQARLLRALLARAVRADARRARVGAAPPRPLRAGLRLHAHAAGGARAAAVRRRAVRARRSSRSRATGATGWRARRSLLGAFAALAFWVSDPDRRIAAHNVERYEATGRIDADYLSRLSADAVPALTAPARAAARAGARAVSARGWPATRDGFAGANLARARARDALAALPTPRRTLARMMTARDRRHPRRRGARGRRLRRGARAAAGAPPARRSTPVAERATTVGDAVAVVEVSLVGLRA